jgi:hypothetical protein
MADASEEEKIPPFVFPKGIAYPTTLFPKFDAGDYRTTLRNPHVISAYKSFFTPQLFSEGPQGTKEGETYEIGIIAQKIESEDYTKEREDGTRREGTRYWLGEAKTLSQSEVDTVREEVKALNTALGPHGIPSQMDDLTPYLDKLTEEYYITPYISKLPPTYEAGMLEGTYWDKNDFYPILGQTEPIQAREFLKYEKQNPFKFGQDWGSWLNNPKKRKKREKPPQMGISCGLTPVNLFKDFNCEGEWVEVDEASGWGSLGQRKQPKNLKKPEHFEAWNEWTNRFLLSECVSSDGKMYLYAASAKGWNARRKSWNQTYYGASFMIDLNRLRPVGDLKQIVQAQQRVVEQGYYDVKEVKKTSLGILPLFDEVQNPLTQLAYDITPSQEGEDDEGGFEGLGTLFDTDKTDEKPFNPYEHLFLPIIKARARAHNATDNTFGYENTVRAYFPTYRGSSFSIGLLNKMTALHERARFKVWKPKKTLDLKAKVEQQLQSYSIYAPIINHKNFVV